MKKILMLSLIIVSVLLFSGCTQEAPEEVPEEQAPPQVPDTTPEDTTEPETQQPATVDASFISEIRCIDGREGRIEARITNTENTELIIGNTVKVMINGLLQPRPECEKKTLAPGESTMCSDLSGDFPIREGKENKIVMNTPSQKISETVICPKSSEEEPEEETE